MFKKEKKKEILRIKKIKESLKGKNERKFKRKE